MAVIVVYLTFTLLLQLFYHFTFAGKTWNYLIYKECGYVNYLSYCYHWLSVYEMALSNEAQPVRFCYSDGLRAYYGTRPTGEASVPNKFAQFWSCRKNFLKPVSGIQTATPGVYEYSRQCCGSGSVESVSFWTSLVWICHYLYGFRSFHCQAIK
jgi:hypothetical protein